MAIEFELIESYTTENMDKLLSGKTGKLELQSLIVGKPLDIVRYILKHHLPEYKLVKKVK